MTHQTTLMIQRDTETERDLQDEKECGMGDLKRPDKTRQRKMRIMGREEQARNKSVIDCSTILRGEAEW